MPHPTRPMSQWTAVDHVAAPLNQTSDWGLPQANLKRMGRAYRVSYWMEAKTQLWTVLVKVTPEKYVRGGQAVSEKYETPSQPLYHHNHQNSIQVSIEASQPDGVQLTGEPHWRMRTDRAWWPTRDDKGVSDW